MPKQQYAGVWRFTCNAAKDNIAKALLAWNAFNAGAKSVHFSLHEIRKAIDGAGILRWAFKQHPILY
jgi:uncharacterized membrane protein